MIKHFKKKLFSFIVTTEQETSKYIKVLINKIIISPYIAL